MNRATLSSRDRRALRLGAWLLIPTLGYGLVLQPYHRELSHARARLDDERALLIRERRLLGEKAFFPQRRERAATALGSNWTRIIRGTDTVSIAASLAGYVSDAAQGAGLVVEQVESATADSASSVRLASGGLTAATVVLRAHGDLERILHFVSDIEAGDTFARIDKLSLVKQPSGETADAELLEVAVTVTGIARVLSHPIVGITSPPGSSAIAMAAGGER